MHEKKRKNDATTVTAGYLCYHRQVSQEEKQSSGVRFLYERTDTKIKVLSW